MALHYCVASLSCMYILACLLPCHGMFLLSPCQFLVTFTIMSLTMSDFALFREPLSLSTASVCFHVAALEATILKFGFITSENQESCKLSASGVWEHFCQLHHTLYCRQISIFPLVLESWFLKAPPLPSWNLLRCKKRMTIFWHFWLKIGNIINSPFLDKIPSLPLTYMERKGVRRGWGAGAKIILLLFSLHLTSESLASSAFGLKWEFLNKVDVGQSQGLGILHW